MTMKFKTHSSSKITVFGCVLALCLSACAPVQLLAPYDEQTDKALTALQRDLETFFVRLQGQIGLPEADYDNYREFYQRLLVDVSAIKLRVSALQRNEITREQVDLLEENIVLLQSIHQEGISDYALVEDLRREFNAAIEAILTLELAKQRERR